MQAGAIGRPPSTKKVDVKDVADEWMVISLHGATPMRAEGENKTGAAGSVSPVF